MRYTFRPLPDWPYEATNPRRSRWAFRAGWAATLSLLGHELRMIDGSECVIGAGFREQDLRLDGLPRSSAREPTHPGVELSFNSSHGRLIYRSDVYERWEHNVRGIALGLQALRAVDRYGITKTGQQYAGWKELGSGKTTGNPTRGRAVVGAYDGDLRKALFATHPDQGGDPEKFRDVMAYKEELDA